MYKLYINILKHILNRNTYNKYKESIDFNNIKEYYPELYKLYITLNKILEEHPLKEDITVDELQIYFYSFYPSSNQSLYSPLFEALAECAVSTDDAVSDYLDALAKRAKISELVNAGVSYVEGGLTDDKLEAVIRGIHDEFYLQTKGEETSDGDFVDISDQLEAELRNEPGFRWYLDSLNKSLGSLRKGDFGFIVARPETGKTTFLASQVAHFCTQDGTLGEEGCILWINNEERSSKVGFRIREAFLSEQSRQKEESKVSEAVLRRVRLPKDLVLHRKEVEKLCTSLSPSLIIIDQLDKIKGFEGDRYDLELKQAYTWARELASRYGPVIGVCQASASAENKKWVGMGDVDSSKTGKQGEADWILGIGRTDNEDSTFVRYMYLSKNKLLGDTDTDPMRRHDKWTVKILPQEAIYEDF